MASPPPPAALCLFHATTFPDMPPALGPDAPLLVVCQKTMDFRFLARRFRVVGEEEAVVDVGCSTGETTRILAKRYGRVLGVEISQESLEVARSLDSKAEYVLLDGLLGKEHVVELIKARGARAIWLDIGGDRALDTVVVYVAYLLQHVGPAVAIIVKSQTLFKQAAGQVEQIRDPAWFASLFQSCAERQREKMHLAHPVKYPLKLEPNGTRPICRFHNYATCKKGDRCPYSHDVCHYCSASGHTANQCEEFLNQIPVGSWANNHTKWEV